MIDFPPFCGADRHVVGYPQARVCVLPVPYEGTVTYGAGASRGPRAILEASAQLEMWDEELERRIDRAGIFTLPPVSAGPDETGPNETGPVEIGPVEIGLIGSGIVQTRTDEPERMMERIHAAALPAIRDGKLLITLGGEHSISYGVFTALLEARGTKFTILQIDAHADLRPTYGGTPHSHACIMARAHDLGLSFVQVGIRSCSEAERNFMRSAGLERNVFWAHRIAAEPAQDWIEAVVRRLVALGDEDVYITVDLDALDSALMPATGTPEPGGLGWYPLLRLLRRISEGRRVIGCDVTELAPIPGLHAPDFLAARLTYKLMGYALHNEDR